MCLDGRTDLEHLAPEPWREARCPSAFGHLLQVLKGGVFILGLPLVEGHRQPLVLDGPVHTGREAVDLLAPPGGARLELEAVGTDVADAVHADEALRVLPRAAADARDEPVAVGESRYFLARLLRNRSLLGPRDDRRERPVDVEHDASPVGSLGETVERGHGSYDTAVLVLIGLVAGFFSALFGVGGGIVVVPLLILLARFKERPAMATSLAAIGLIAAVGTISYALRGDVHWDYGLLLGLPAAVGAVGGTSLQQRIGGPLLSYGFAALLAVVAIWLLI